MSHYTSRAVCCDGCGENSENWIGVSYIKSASLSVIRVALHKMGWTRHHLQDYCPKCTKTLKGG